jgi:ubiquinone/menaquinone biosynthesis C-methylase UbiE
MPATTREDTIEPAKLRYDVILLDLTANLLEKAREQIKNADVERKVKQIIEDSIDDLSMFEDDAFDALICFGGPLAS